MDSSGFILAGAVAANLGYFILRFALGEWLPRFQRDTDGNAIFNPAVRRMLREFDRLQIVCENSKRLAGLVNVDIEIFESSFEEDPPGTLEGIAEVIQDFTGGEMHDLIAIRKAAHQVAAAADKLSGRTARDTGFDRLSIAAGALAAVSAFLFLIPNRSAATPFIGAVFWGCLTFGAIRLVKWVVNGFRQK